MTGNDLVLRFRPPPENESQHANDMRTVNIKQVTVVDGQEAETDLYKFYHPVLQGVRTGVTSYHRRNPSTGMWMSAGQIDWQSDSTASVFFGGSEKVHIRELRKSKKAASKSRRFKANGSEYKWKIAENGQDMTVRRDDGVRAKPLIVALSQCISQQITNYGKNIAEWSQETLTLRVAERAEPILDRVVVTLFLNLWMKNIDDW